MPLYHVHNREFLRLRPYDHRGRLRSAALVEWSRFLRCTHTGQVRPIHWRLLVVLYELWIHFGQPQVTVFSGNRPGMVARLKTSRHISGHAVDFNFDGIANTEVRDYLLKHYDQVGVGYYPNSWHVHLDVRPEKSFWIDKGRAGEEASYSRTPAEDLRAERRKRRDRSVASSRAVAARGEGLRPVRAPSPPHQAPSPRSHE